MKQDRPLVACSHWRVKALASGTRRMEELLVRRALLDLAIQVQLHGPDALQSAPIHGALVEHHKTDAGFELRYQIPGTDKPETLKVPAKK